MHDEPDAEPRPALGLHLAARREGQPADELRPGDRPADLRRATAASRIARSTSRTTRASSRGSAPPGPPERPLGGARRLRHLAVHGRHRRQPAAAAQPAVLLRVGGDLRHDDRRRQRRAAASPGWCPARRRPATCAPTIRTCGRSSRSSGTGSSSTRSRSSMSAQVGYVGHHADHLVTPVEGNQALPGVGDPVDVGAKDHAPAARSARSRSSRPSRRPPRAAAAATTRCRRACASALPRRGVPGVVHAGQGHAPTTAASTACSAAPARRA